MDQESQIRLVLVGDRSYPRYSVTFNRSRFSPTLYWARAANDPWTSNPSGAMKWADYEAAELAVGETESGEPNDSAGRK
jgi:hypothetical protein